MKFSGRFVKDGNFGSGDYASSSHPVVWKLSAMPTVSFLFPGKNSREEGAEAVCFSKVRSKTSPARAKGFKNKPRACEWPIFSGLFIHLEFWAEYTPPQAHTSQLLPWKPQHEQKLIRKPERTSQECPRTHWLSEFAFSWALRVSLTPFKVSLFSVVLPKWRRK